MPPVSWARSHFSVLSSTDLYTRAFKQRPASRIPNARLLIALMVQVSVFVPLGEAQTCGKNVPHIDGVWKTLPYLMPINPISATLLNTGRVLIVAGSENDASNNSKGAESYRNA